MKNVADMSTKEILDELNALTGGSVKRFASRADGEKRLLKARGAPAAEVAVVDEPEEKPKAKATKKVARNKTEAKAQAAKESPKREPKEPKVPKERAKSVSDSWNNAAVREARSRRLHVVCNDKPYRSVGMAFKELGLPMKDHIRFRATLRDEQKVKYDHNGKVFNFRLVDSEEYYEMKSPAKAE